MIQPLNHFLIAVYNCRDDVRIVECSSCGERQDVTEKCRKCDIQFGKVRTGFIFLQIFACFFSDAVKCSQIVEDYVELCRLRWLETICSSSVYVTKICRS
jgi:hypothetical protein